MTNYFQNKIIVLFDLDFRAVAFVTLSPLTIDFVGNLNHSDKEVLLNFVQNIKNNPPRIKKEFFTDDSVEMDFEQIKDDSDMLIGVLEEIKALGFVAKSVPASLRQVLVYISNAMTTLDRTKIISELVNLPDDTEPEAIAELEKLIVDVAPINLGTTPLT